MNAREESESSRRQEETERLYQRLDPHGEILPTSEELVKIEEEQKRQKMINELAGDIEIKFQNYIMEKNERTN